MILDLYIIHDRSFFLPLLDPWEYRVKRATMTTKEKEEYDLSKVILLETLGNARLDESYDFILSHINSTNSPWIKRAGCHALRNFDHEHVILKLYTQYHIFLV